MNTTNDNIEGMVKTAIKMASIEKPSDNFLNSVMDKVDGLGMERDQKIIVNPLITWKGWLFIGVTIIAIFALLSFFGISSVSLSYFDSYIDKVRSISFSFPISISISKIFLTGLFAFVFFFIIEISLITRRLKDI